MLEEGGRVSLPLLTHLQPSRGGQPRPQNSPCPLPQSHRGLLTGCAEPGLEQKMVYFRMTPLGLVGGSQDTTTLLAEEGTALIPAGGPGTGERRGTGGDPGGEERLPRTGGPRPSPRKGPSENTTWLLQAKQSMPEEAPFREARLCGGRVVRQPSAPPPASSFVFSKAKHAHGQWTPQASNSVALSWARATSECLDHKSTEMPAWRILPEAGES